MATHLAAVTLGVAKGKGTPEGTLDQFTLLPEHGVQGGVPGYRVAQPLHGFNVFFAITWGKKQMCHLGL